MKKCLFLSCLLLQIWICRADGYYCKHIGIENGLSQSAITTMTYHESGSLWIGTRFGLNEYRNGRLRTFLDDETSRLEGTYIYFLFCDCHGNLWTSTDKGLFRYDAAKDFFILISDSQVTAAVDTESGIWFGTHFGVKFYSHESGTLAGEDTDTYTDYQQLFFHNGDLHALDKRNGLVRYRNGTAEDIAFPELEGGTVMASALDGSTLYLSLLNYGLIAYDLDTHRIVHTLPGGKGGLPKEPLLALMVSEGKLWMGFDGACVWLMDIGSKQLEPLRLQPAQSGGHIPLSVTSLYNDPHGNIWIGSVRFGLTGLKQSPIKAFSLTDADPSSENVIISVCSSRDGNIYLGTDGSGIWKYTPSSGLSFFAGDNGLKVTSIADFDDKTLCIATYNRGFFLLDRASAKLRPFILVDEKTNDRECFSSNAPTIYALGDGRLMFLAVDTYIYSPRTRKFEIIKDESEGEGMELVVIGSYGNNLFYAYSNAGLFTINTETMSMNLIYRSTVDNGTVNTAVYHGGLIWFGTNYGLFSFDPRSGNVNKVESGLFSRVSWLESSGADILWIAANNSLFLSRNGVMEMTGENRGVPANEILSGACAPDGTIYLGGTAGLVEIGADCFFSTEENKKVELQDKSSGSLKVPYKYTSLHINVNLTGADPFERVLYRYTISGSSDLTTESYEQSLSLPALKPGMYNVKVSYLKSDGTWSIAQSIAQVKVLHPWYSSTVMILVYILLGMVMVAAIIDWISRKRITALEAELRAWDAAFTAKVDAFIDEHLSDTHLSVSDLANHMAMSRATLYYRMNSSFGKGVAEVIEEKRMAKAEELLCNSSFSVLDISEKVGYSTSRYFSTRFKLLHGGQTPLKYRQSHR